MNSGTYTWAAPPRRSPGGLTVQGRRHADHGLQRAAACDRVRQDADDRRDLNASSTGATIEQRLGQLCVQRRLDRDGAADPEHHRPRGAEHRRERDAHQRRRPAPSTTFTRFDNIAFNNGATGAVRSTCRSRERALPDLERLPFGVGDGDRRPAVAVKLTGNGTRPRRRDAHHLRRRHLRQQRTATTAAYCHDSWTVGRRRRQRRRRRRPPATNGGGRAVRARRRHGHGRDDRGVPDGGVRLEHVRVLLDLRRVPRRVAGRSTGSTCGTRPGAAKYSWDTRIGETIVGTPR